MNNDQCRRLIELYRSYRPLWDSRDPRYTIKSLKEDAWNKISHEMNLPSEQLKRKMDSLLGSYRREKSREKKSRIMGSGHRDVYKSNWYAYKYFTFMADKNNPGTTQDTMHGEEAEIEWNLIEVKQETQTNRDSESERKEGQIQNETETERREGQQPHTQPPRQRQKKYVTGTQRVLTDGMLSQPFRNINKVIRETQNSRDSKSGQREEQIQNDTKTVSKRRERQQTRSQPPRKRQRKHVGGTREELADDMLSQAFRLLKQYADSSTDSCFTFGQYIASELRKYDPITLAHVKNAISNIIFEADIGRYQQYSTGNYTQSYACASGYSPASSGSSHTPIPTPSPMPSPSLMPSPSPIPTPSTMPSPSQMPTPSTLPPTDD